LTSFAVNSTQHTRLNVVTDCGIIPDDGLIDGPEYLLCQEDLVAMGGGELFFPCGTYDFNGTHYYYEVPVDSNVTLVGESEGCVVLNTQSANKAQRVVGTWWLDQRTVVNAGIKNLTIRGNRTTCPANGGVHQAHGIVIVNSEGFRASNVTIENVWGDGIYLSVWANNTSLPDMRVKDFCRNGMTVNSGTFAPTSSSLRVTNLDAQPALDATYGYDFDAEGGIYELELAGSDLWVIHLGGVWNGNIHDNIIRSYVAAAYGDNIRMHHNTHTTEDARSAINCDHCGMFTISDSTFYCNNGLGDGTCIYTLGTYGDDAMSSVRNNVFVCETPPCYAAHKRIADQARLNGDHFTFSGNKVIGGFTYGSVNSEVGSYHAYDNIIQATNWCISVGGGNGVQGEVNVHDNTYIDCTTDLKTNYPPHAFPITDHDADLADLFDRVTALETP